MSSDVLLVEDVEDELLLVDDELSDVSSLKSEDRLVVDDVDDELSDGGGPGGGPPAPCRPPCPPPNVLAKRFLSSVA